MMLRFGVIGHTIKVKYDFLSQENAVHDNHHDWPVRWINNCIEWDFLISKKAGVEFWELGKENGFGATESFVICELFWANWTGIGTS